MRDKIVDLILKKLNLSNNEKIKFALGCLYTFITKLFAIIILSVILNIKKTVILLIAFMLPLRSFGFGLHAKNNTQCWVLTIFMYILIPLILSLIKINDYIMIIAAFVSSFIILVFAPAPTKNIPLLNKKKNVQRKIIIGFIICFYLSIIFINNYYYLKEAITLALIYQALLVSPLVYRIFDSSFKKENQFLKHWF